MKPVNLLIFASLLGLGCGAQASIASQFRLPEEIGRVEGTRDLNIFQVEPSLIDERFYTTGRCERRQYVGNILPEGAEIPDSDPAPKKAAANPQPSDTLHSSRLQQVAPNKIPASSATIKAK